MESMHGTALGWLLAGVFLGWLGNWLFDMLYRRDGRRAGELTDMQVNGFHADLDRLQRMLGERDARLDAMHAELRELTQRLAAWPPHAPSQTSLPAPPDSPGTAAPPPTSLAVGSPAERRTDPPAESPLPSSSTSSPEETAAAVLDPAAPVDEPAAAADAGAAAAPARSKSATRGGRARRAASPTKP